MGSPQGPFAHPLPVQAMLSIPTNRPRDILAALGLVLGWLCFSLFLATCSPVVPQIWAQEQPSEAGTWQRMAPAPTMRTEVAAAVVGEIIYVLGGFSKPNLSNFTHLSIANTVEAYQPSTDQWTTTATLPARLHHAAAASVGNRLYVIGGFTGSFLSIWSPVASVFMYDPSTDTWAERAPMPTPRGALAVGTHHGKIYALGGFTAGGNTGAVEVYDPETDTWSSKSPMPTPRDHLAVAIVAGRLYAIGGRINRNYAHNLAVTEVFDPSTDQWSEAAEMPTPRSGITAGVISEQIYVVGGEAPEGTFRTTEVYSAASGQWYTGAPMPTGRHGLAGAVVNGQFYAISGGPSPGGSYSNVNERYTPASPVTLSLNVNRASPAQVGTVMALLATFQNAGVLPPENSPDANRLIKALIQFQAAFMKSSNPAIAQLLRNAISNRLGADAPAVLQQFTISGWTSRSLEAFVDYTARNPIWNQPAIREGFKDFNVGQEDFELMARVFTEARVSLSSSNQDIHAVYAQWRRTMPGSNL